MTDQETVVSLLGSRIGKELLRRALDPAETNPAFIIVANKIAQDPDAWADKIFAFLTRTKH